MKDPQQKTLQRERIQERRRNEDEYEKEIEIDKI